MKIPVGTRVVWCEPDEPDRERRGEVVDDTLDTCALVKGETPNGRPWWVAVDLLCPVVP